MRTSNPLYLRKLQETARKFSLNSPMEETLEVQSPNTRDMHQSPEDLRELRNIFDVEVRKHGLSSSTIKRYRAWIRRFIRYCSHHGVFLAAESVPIFLRSYDSHLTRRQGYYALKFFIRYVIKLRTYPKLSDCYPITKTRSPHWLKWWKMQRSKN